MLFTIAMLLGMIVSAAVAATTYAAISYASVLIAFSFILFIFWKVSFKQKGGEQIEINSETGWNRRHNREHHLIEILYLLNIIWRYIIIYILGIFR